MKRFAIYSLFTMIVGVSMIGSSCCCVKKEGVVTTPPSRGQVCFNVQPPGADVYVDGRLVGRADDFTRARGCMALDAGPHKISVRMRSNASHDTTVVVGSSPKYVNVTLNVLGPPPPPTRPQPVPPPPPRPIEGRICFSVQPADADVYIDGRLMGRANEFTSARGCLSLGHGPHKVTVSKRNFTTHEQTIVAGSKPRYVTIKLKNLHKPAPRPPAQPPPPAPKPPAPLPKPAPPPPKAVKGRVCFNVQPANADVYIDGRLMGRANELTAARGCLALDRGPHKVSIRKPKFRTHEQDIFVGAGTVNVNARLSNINKPTKPERPDQTPKTGPPKQPVKPGPPKPVKPGPPPTSAKPPKAAKGKVCFNVQPADADVYVDGKLIGRANDFSAAKACMLVDKGERTITVHKKNFSRHDQKIVVGDGVRNISVKLKSEKKK